MANTSLKIGGNNWAVKEDNLLGYNVIQNKYVPIEIDTVRATTATRVNENGLIEVVPKNLALYSEQFDNAYWGKSNAVVTANDMIAPNGTLTADKATSTINGTSTIQRNFYVNNSTQYTFSVFAKKGTQQIIQLQASNIGNIGTFDLSNGTIISGVNAKIEDCGNGWYRCSGIQTGVSIGYFTGYILGLNSIVDSYFYIWGAQLEANSTATDYFPTTDRLNIPRIDYSSGEASLLIEGQRTNLALRSEEFNDLTIWPGSAGVVRLANQGIAPNGTNTMDLITFPVALNSISQAISVTSGISYTFSIWLATQSGTQTVEIGNINSGVYETVIATTTPQRFEITQVASSATRYPAIRATANCSILLWGAQVEAGSNATSYIPTVASSVTRNQDVISKTGISGLIGQTEGTMFVELNLRNLLGNVNRRILCISNNNSASENIQLTFTSSLTNTIRAVVATGGNFPLITSSQITNIGKIKIALSYSAVNVKLYINGIKQGIDLGEVAKPILNSIQLGSLNNADYLNDGINSVQLYKTALTDEQCINLTTI